MSYLIKWEAPVDKDVRKTLTNRASPLFRELELTEDQEVKW